MNELPSPSVAILFQVMLPEVSPSLRLLSAVAFSKSRRIDADIVGQRPRNAAIVLILKRIMPF